MLGSGWQESNLLLPRSRRGCLPVTYTLVWIANVSAPCGSRTRLAGLKALHPVRWTNGACVRRVPSTDCIDCHTRRALAGSCTRTRALQERCYRCSSSEGICGKQKGRDPSGARPRLHAPRKRTPTRRALTPRTRRRWGARSLLDSGIRGEKCGT